MVLHCQSQSWGSNPRHGGRISMWAKHKNAHVACIRCSFLMNPLWSKLIRRPPLRRASKSYCGQGASEFSYIYSVLAAMHVAPRIVGQSLFTVLLLLCLSACECAFLDSTDKAATGCIFHIQHSFNVQLLVKIRIINRHFLKAVRVVINDGCQFFLALLNMALIHP